MSATGLPPALVAQLDQTIADGAADVRRGDDPVVAEQWASHIVGTFDAARRASGSVPPLEAMLLERCAELGTDDALLVAAALAAVVPPPFHTMAAEVAAALRSAGAAGPPWLAQVGRARATTAVVAGNAADPQRAVIVAFAQPGDTAEHALVVLVDDDGDGMAKDVWLAPDADEVVALWGQNPLVELEEVSGAEGLALVAAALVATDTAIAGGDLSAVEPTALDDLALARARCRLVPPVAPAPRPRTRQPTGSKLAPPPTDEVEASAAAAVAPARLDALASFYGKGRPLTTTGQVTLADARVLAPLLDLGEVPAGVKSAGDLVGLTFWTRWALATKVIRKEKGRYKATASWPRLDPLERFRAAADALPRMGPLRAFPAMVMIGAFADLVDGELPSLLAWMLTGGSSYAEALSVLEAAATKLAWTGVWADESLRHRQLDRQLDLLVKVLAWAGIAAATPSGDTFDLALTAAGRWWLLEGVLRR